LPADNTNFEKYGLGGILGACKRFGTFARRNPAENNAAAQEMRATVVMQPLH
jgi:hypothetical protein